MVNGTEDLLGLEPVSPVTLSANWSRVARLLLVTAMSVAGSVGNVFMISAVMIEDHLRKRGNAFLVNIALADMLITGIVMPASVIALLADLNDPTQVSQVVCTVQWSLALISCLVSLLSLATIAMENYARLYLPNCYTSLSPCCVTTIVLLIWTASVTVVAVQIILNLGPDYCYRTSQGLVPYQIAVGVCFVIVPIIIILICYSLIAYRVRSANTIPAYRTQYTFNADYHVVKTNILAFIIFILFWLPFGSVLIRGHSISRRVFYYLAWFALSKSCVNNLVYCISNRFFRNAYVNLFHYCCCKTTVSFSRRSREAARPSGDVRVHIIPAYNINYTSPSRGRESTKGSGKRTALSRPTAYEL